MSTGVAEVGGGTQESKIPAWHEGSLRFTKGMAATPLRHRRSPFDGGQASDGGSGGMASRHPHTGQGPHLPTPNSEEAHSIAFLKLPIVRSELTAVGWTHSFRTVLGLIGTPSFMRLWS